MCFVRPARVSPPCRLEWDLLKWGKLRKIRSGKALREIQKGLLGDFGSFFPQMRTQVPGARDEVALVAEEQLLQLPFGLENDSQAAASRTARVAVLATDSVCL